MIDSPRRHKSERAAISQEAWEYVGRAARLIYPISRSDAEDLDQIAREEKEGEKYLH